MTVDNRFTSIRPWTEEATTTEPALYELIFKYYNQYFSDEQSKSLTDQYIVEWVKLEGSLKCKSQ